MLFQIISLINMRGSKMQFHPKLVRLNATASIFMMLNRMELRQITGSLYLEVLLGHRLKLRMDLLSTTYIYLIHPSQI
jgi:hypothetical protein